MNKNYYEILGLDVTATAAEIKKAYKKLAGRYHPDKLHGQDPEEIAQAEVEFKQVEEAYRVLKDPINRAHFDQTGEGKMPRSKEMATAKIIELFAKHIKAALEYELATEMDSHYSSMLAALNAPSRGIDSVLETVRKELEQEIKQTETTINNLEKGVAKLNKVKRKVRTKNGTSNIYAQVIEEQLRATSGALAGGGIQLIALKTALAALDDYEYVLEDAEFLLNADEAIECPKCDGRCYAFETTPCGDHPELNTWSVECNDCDYEISGAPDRASAVSEFREVSS